MHSLLKRLLPITLERCNDSERCYSMWASVARSLAWQSGTVDATPLPIMQVPRSLLQRTAIGINLGVIRTPRRTHLTMMGSRQERAAQGCSSQLVATGAMLVRRHPPLCSICVVSNYSRVPVQWFAEPLDAPFG